MRLLPSEQTEAQKEAITLFFATGRVRLEEPCNCGTQVRHNNGGNYHDIVSIRMDAGRVWRSLTFTGDYSPPEDWKETSFPEAISEIAKRVAEGWHATS